MGCFVSTPKDADECRRRSEKLGEVAVFVPGLRVPKSIDFSQPLGDSLSTVLVDRLSALRTQVVVMTAQETPMANRPRRKTATQHGGSTMADLLQALEDYLPVILGLAGNGNKLKYKVKFAWINQEDDTEDTAMADVSYEILSILHLMAMICLYEANLLLLPKAAVDGTQSRAPEEGKRSAIDILLKAAGYLDCAIQHVLPQISVEQRKDLPIDLAEEKKIMSSLHASIGSDNEEIKRNKLYQSRINVDHDVYNSCYSQGTHMEGIDLQLSLAIDSPKATLAVKRRLACEMVKCWHQAKDNISKLPAVEGLGQKHRLFVEWKYNEAKAAAYYYHGLILDEGNTERSHGMAVTSLKAAEEFLKESKKACETFNATPPVSRNPPLWGSMKIIETAPSLPDFMVALKPDDYHLPPLDPSWNTEETSHGST
ncbi:hypothetical protein HPP92_014762 [Vanilla planifolia]|uniref:BRO1 domain-containing protein n=1 Tax=Vanilla planifolia TaxID=51239 RepID=A0A835QM62_VANPL|nr:hypothetical protein HPP92_014762 [Vanilla planifolia]